MDSKFPPIGGQFLYGQQGRSAVEAATWTSWILAHRRDLDLTAPHNCVSHKRTVTLQDIINRIAEITGDDIPRLSFEDAFKRYGDDTLAAQPVFNNIAWSTLWRHDHAFPWENVILDIMGNIPKVTPDPIHLHSITWHEREEMRLAFGIYARPSWKLPPIPGHYAHVSIEESAFIAYTADEKKGERDIQTRIKPGRYLAKFYPDMDPELVNKTQAQVASLKNGVCFATTEDDILRVFKEGPQSCMSHDLGQYGLSQHPVTAYADGDLHIAYLCDNRGRITARCTAWPEKKIYYQGYGDTHKLNAGLNALGYRSGGEFCFEGAKIKRILDKRNPTRIIVPAIDGNRRFNPVDKEWLVVASRGTYDYGTGAAGCITLDEPVACAKCAQEVQPKFLLEVHRYGRICKDCRNSLGVAQCPGDPRHRYYALEDLREVRWDRSQKYKFGPHALEARCFYCHGSKQWYGNNTHFGGVTMADGKRWEQKYFEQNGVERDGKKYPKESANAYSA